MERDAIIYLAAVIPKKNKEEIRLMFENEPDFPAKPRFHLA